MYFRFAIIISCLFVNFQLKATSEFPQSIVLKYLAVDEIPKIKAVPGMRQRSVGIGLTSTGLGLLGG